MTYIRLDKLREYYKPEIPAVLEENYQVDIDSSEDLLPVEEEIKRLFPNTCHLPLLTIQESNGSKRNNMRPLHVGVVLSGGQAPGGHNVIAAIYDALKAYHAASRLYGFLMGPGGLIKHQFIELHKSLIDRYRNSGGFDMIGSDRTKIECVEDFERVIDIAHRLDLSALVIIGGDDSATNGALLAEYCAEKEEKLCVIGCPKTIDGDLKNRFIETSFGFDTCVKVYAELVGNIQRDCYSAKKYWHFIKLMGRSASHLTLECALQTQPTIAIISEEVEAKQQTLDDIVQIIADVVVDRYNRGYPFGVVLIPEGLIEFVPRMRRLINELNEVLRVNEKNLLIVKKSEVVRYIASKLTTESAEVFLSLPNEVAGQLMLERDPHGNVQVSRVQTEELIVSLVRKELKKRKERGNYDGKFSALTHFFGYEGRSSMPSNFDAAYCYALGLTAVALASHHANGYMAAVGNLVAFPGEWKPRGVPFVSMMHMEEREGRCLPVVKKSLVDLEGTPFHYFVEHREQRARAVDFRYPGPIQYFGPSAVCDSTTITLRLEHDLSAEEDSEEALREQH